MRPWIVRFAVLILLLQAPSASAAPTCEDRLGTAIRCGTSGAMPVGWKPAPDVLLKRQIEHAADADPKALYNAIFFIVLLLTLIALLPEFDGRTDEDWDEQEGDDRRR
jgi:hypothetical protein